MTKHIYITLILNRICAIFCQAKNNTNASNIGLFAESLYNFENSIANRSYSLNVADTQISENHRFRYHVFHPEQSRKSEKVILIFHRFNEKYWVKYLP